MKNFFTSAISLAAALFLSGCAAFTSGEIKIDKDIATDMFADSSKKAFADITLSWENYPYQSGTDKIGHGEIDQTTGDFKQEERKHLPADPADQQKLLDLAKKIFKKAGLYDRNSGSGTLNLNLETVNRWTYGELVNSYLVETPFVMIFPRSLPTGYSLSTKITTSTGTANIELMATNRTYFFLLLAPVYPLFSPSSGEKTIFNQILWRMATEIYEARRKADKAILDDPQLLKRLNEEKAAKAAKLKAEAEAAAKAAQEAEEQARKEEEEMPSISAEEQLKNITENAGNSPAAEYTEQTGSTSEGQANDALGNTGTNAESADDEFMPTVVMTE